MIADDLLLINGSPCPCGKDTKDIRDKYVLSRLVWDLGIIDEFSQEVKKQI